MNTRSLLHSTAAQAKRDLSLGRLSEFWIQRATMADSWNVVLQGGSHQGLLIDAHHKQPRCFKTLDAAVNALALIGLQVQSMRVGDFIAITSEPISSAA